MAILPKVHSKHAAGTFIINLSYPRLRQYIVGNKHKFSNISDSKEEQLRNTIKAFFSENPTLAKVVSQTSYYQNGSYNNLVRIFLKNGL